MTEQARKRRRQSDEILLASLSQHRPKKQKVNHPAQPPAGFWDNLSEIPLTKNALRELDQRNTRSFQRPRRGSHTQARRPLTRSIAAAWRDSHPTAAQYLAYCTPACRRRVGRFASHGGPDLTDLRHYTGPGALEYEMSSSQSILGRRKRGLASPKKSTLNTKSTGPYDRAFQQHLVDFGVYPKRYEYPDGRVPPQPENIQEVREALARPRPSLSPSQFSEEEFDEFQRADAHAAKEKQVTTSVIPLIEGRVEDRRCAAGEIPFTNLDHLTDGSLVAGNPDLYYGARPEQLNRRVRAELAGHIIPSTQHDLPIVPNFFLAAKGPDGSLEVASRQASYDGTLGARGYQSLQSYAAGKSGFDNKAHTITTTYHGGTLKMYTVHPIQPASAGAPPEYVMTQIDSWSLTGNATTFRQGAAAYRNAMDWTKLERDGAIEKANETAARLDAGGTPSATGPSLEFHDRCIG